MAPDAFSMVLLQEIAEGAGKPLAVASRARIIGILENIDTTDLNQFDWDKLLDVVRDGRRNMVDSIFNDVMIRLQLEIGVKATPNNNILQTDIDDRLRAAVFIIQKYPEHIPTMLDSLWNIHKELQAYLTTHDITPQSRDLSLYDNEILSLLDIINNIALYAVARIPEGAYPSPGTYLFSGNPRDLECLLAELGPLYEVYTCAVDIQDTHIQDFIHALQRNKHTDVVLGHEFTRKTPFITALLQALKA